MMVTGGTNKAGRTLTFLNHSLRRLFFFWEGGRGLRVQGLSGVGCWVLALRFNGWGVLLFSMVGISQHKPKGQSPSCRDPEGL